MSQTMDVTEAKERLSELVAAVAANQVHVEITRNGSLGAVLISHEELAALQETIAILSDSRAGAGAMDDQTAGRRSSRWDAYRSHA